MTNTFYVTNFMGHEVYISQKQYEENKDALEEQGYTVIEILPDISSDSINYNPEYMFAEVQDPNRWPSGKLVYSSEEQARDFHGENWHKHAVVSPRLPIDPPAPQPKGWYRRFDHKVKK